jgi:hypothetical protein
MLRMIAVRVLCEHDGESVTYLDFDEVAVDKRLYHARFDPSSGAYGPTPEQRESMQIARDLYETVNRELSELVDVEYASLKVALDAASVP